MCIMWMPANLISSGIVDKNDKIFKKENKSVKTNEENSEITAETKAVHKQTETKNA